MNVKKIGLGLVVFLISLVIVNAIDFTPQGDINLRDIYDLKNVVDYDGAKINLTGNITASYFLGNGSELTGIDEKIVIVNNSMKDYVDSADTSLNSSLMSWVLAKEYYNNVANLTGVLDTVYVRISNLVSLVGNWSADKSSYQIWTTTKTYIDSIGNWTADKGSYYTSTQTDTEIETANTSMKTYTDDTFITQANEGNLNVNHSDTSGTATTWDEETSQANLNVNSSTWWALLSGWSSTRFENVANELSIKMSWFNTSADARITNAEPDLNVNSSDNWDNLNSPSDISAGDITDDGTFTTPAEVIAFGYYNSSDFVITDYFTKTAILGFGYYNSSDFVITDYFTSAEVLAFNYYNSSDFSISDYVTSAALAGYNYYNSSDFVITDYYTKTQVDAIVTGIGNFSAWDKAYEDLINKPTVLSDFTDDLGNRGYTSNLNFSNDAGYITTDTNASTACTGGEILYGNGTCGVPVLSESDPVFSAWDYSTLLNKSTDTYVETESDPVYTAWDKFTGIPHATPSNGDITHFSYADEIYDWVIGLGYSTTTGTVTSVTGTSPVVSSGGNTPAISMPKATSSVDGYLDNADWTTFNSKSDTIGTVTDVGATSPIVSSGGASPAISATVLKDLVTTAPLTGAVNDVFLGTDSDITIAMPVATTSADGYLSSTNWNTFNNKASSDTTYSAGNGISLSTTTFSVAGGTALTQDAGGLSVTADGITDTQLAFNTGQHLTTTSNPTFNNATITDCIIFTSGGKICSST